MFNGIEGSPLWTIPILIHGHGHMVLLIVSHNHKISVRGYRGGWHGGFSMFALFAASLIASFSNS